MVSCEGRIPDVYLNEEVCCMADEPTGGESIGGEAARLLTAALIGGIVGAALGLLLAPKAGTELRSDIRDRAGVAAEKAQGIGEKAKLPRRISLVILKIR